MSMWWRVWSKDSRGTISLPQKKLSLFPPSPLIISWCWRQKVEFVHNFHYHQQNSPWKLNGGKLEDAFYHLRLPTSSPQHNFHHCWRRCKMTGMGADSVGTCIWKRTRFHGNASGNTCFQMQHTYPGLWQTKRGSPVSCGRGGTCTTRWASASTTHNGERTCMEPGGISGSETTR